MASTQFAFGVVADDLPSFYFDGSTVELKTPTASSSPTTAAASATQSVCRVTSDVQVKVSFGTAPNAGTDAGALLIPAGTTEYFRVKSGDKAAVITA